MARHQIAEEEMQFENIRLPSETSLERVEERLATSSIENAGKVEPINFWPDIGLNDKQLASAPFKFKWAYGPGRTIGNVTVNVEFLAIIVPLEDYWKCTTVNNQ